MIKYDKLNIFLREHYLIFLFVIILSPIFISLDFSQGLNFDQFIFKSSNLGGGSEIRYRYPSIPISVLIVSVLSIYNLKDLLSNKKIQILSFLVIMYICLNLYFGITRAAIVGSGMMFIIVSYYIFLRIISNRNAYKDFYIALSFIIIVKLLFDIYFYQIQGIGQTTFLTHYFISSNFAIYNFYDYFPFIYFLATALSVHNLLRRRYLILSLIVLVVSNVAIIGTESRLFIYSIYLVPFLYIFYQFTKLSLERYFYLFLFVSLAIIFIGNFSVFICDLGPNTQFILTFIADATCISPLSDQLTDSLNRSLLARAYNIQQYFGNFSLVNLIFPFLNEYRIKSSSSLHNELLEIFSFFGFVIVYYLFLLKQIFCNTKREFKFISYLLMFVLIIGTLMQINISNPYVGIITGTIFAVISSGSTKIRQ